MSASLISVAILAMVPAIADAMWTFSPGGTADAETIRLLVVRDSNAGSDGRSNIDDGDFTVNPLGEYVANPLQAVTRP